MIGARTSQESTELSGAHREIRMAPIHHHPVLDKAWLSASEVADKEISGELHVDKLCLFLAICPTTKFQLEYSFPHHFILQ